MTRNFSSTLLFESVLDTIQPTPTLLYSTAQSLLKPRLTLVEEDCGTLLGYPFPISFRAEGNVEVETGLRIDSARLGTLITAGEVVVPVRGIETCISEGGICRQCAAASRPRLAIPPVNSILQIVPELILDNSQYPIMVGQNVIPLAYSTDQFDVLYVFENGNLIDESQYVVSGSTLTLNVPAPGNTIFVIKYVVYSNSQFFHWLSGTYSGSLLGVKQLAKTLLPIKKTVLASVIPEEDLKSLIEDIRNSPAKAEDSVQYLLTVKDPVEKALFAVILGAIFLG
jgi:hypothetical protein